MFRPTRFYHTFEDYDVLADDISYLKIIRSTFITPQEKGAAGPYVHRTEDAESGHTHERYFDTIREFVTWHYKQYGWSTLDEEDLEEEVTVSYSEAAAAVAAAQRVVRPCSRRLNRHVFYDDEPLVIQ